MDADSLPRRVAQVTHALMAREKDEAGMVTTLQVCEYDSAAPSVAATRNALNRARAFRLADGYNGLWFATNTAWLMRKALEERVLAMEDANA